MKLITNIVIFYVVLQYVTVLGSLPKNESILDKQPIIYSDAYNLYFYGIERFHPFDAYKYGKVATNLCKKFGWPKDIFFEPKPATEQELLLIHTPEYLQSLKKSYVVARITEVFPLIFVPNYILQKKILYPMLLATGGTIQAAELAYINKKWAINLSGGYHRAEPDMGDGFCVYADIPIAMNLLWDIAPHLKIMYIDCDAHQGNGVEISLKNELEKSKPRLIIFDVFSKDDYPTGNLTPSINDWLLSKLTPNNPMPLIWQRARDIQKYIQYSYPMPVGKHRPTTDQEYLTVIRNNLKEAIEKEKPNFIFYNAGSDPFYKDPIAWMGLTKEGIIERDQLVWQYAKDHDIPLVMTLSGGYAPESASIISDSIANALHRVWGMPYAS